MKHHYLELRENNNLVGRVKTTHTNFNKDWERLEKETGKDISYVQSSEKEKEF